MNILYELKHGYYHKDKPITKPIDPKADVFLSDNPKVVKGVKIPIRKFTFHKQNWNIDILRELNKAAKATGLWWGIIDMNKYNVTVLFEKR